VDRLTDVESSHPAQRQGGITPLYAAPELLRGTVSRHCDLYSLAIVYQQLLTGTVPFWCQNMYQLMLLHMSGEPNVTPLPESDRPIVRRALSKRAEDRFPSCLDFMQALICGESGSRADLPRRAAVVKRISSILRPTEPEKETPKPAAASDATSLVRKPTTEAPRPQPGLCPTLPSKEDNLSQTPPFGGTSTLSRSLLADKKLGPPRAGHRSASLPAPTCAALPGYRFLECISQTPLGDVWTAEDQQGRPRRALCLQNFVEQNPILIERLQSLRHDTLAPLEIAWSPSGRLVLVLDAFEQTLCDRLEARQKQGQPGIPRDELLGHLRTVAVALDALYQQHSLPHLGLTPRTLMLKDNRIWVTDFGLMPLVWLPTGQTVGSLNGRYAAPELFEKPDLTGIPPGEASWAALMGRACSASDQFSLALIYAEMLNGIPPQLQRASGGGARRHGSGGVRRAGRSDSGLIPLRGQPRVDLDLLPTCDRAILLRAMHDDPQQRYPSCTALVEALESAVAISERCKRLYHRLPAVIPFTSLQGEPPPNDLQLPPIHQLVLNLAMPHPASIMPSRTIQGPQNIRYVIQANDLWECKCPVQIFSGALALKVEGFRVEYKAQVVCQKDDGFLFHIDIQYPPRPGDREASLVARIAFELDVQASSNSIKYFAEARMRVYPVSGDHERIARLLPELAPRYFDSMRRYLQASPEQRSQDRWQCPQPLHVYPVLPDLELGEILDGISRNISLGGVSFRVAKQPSTEQVYLHWHKSPTVSPYALLARIIRIQPMAGGGFEVGATFPS
jgi:serine/threonine protein kinase